MTTYLTEAFERLRAGGVPIGAVFTGGRAWSDNDNFADLQTSRERVSPRIRDAGAARLEKAKAASRP